MLIYGICLLLTKIPTTILTMAFATVSADGLNMVIDDDLFLARFPEHYSGHWVSGGTHTIRLTGHSNAILPGPFNGASHPQESAALCIQATGYDYGTCIRCFEAQRVNFGAAHPIAVFKHCRSRKNWSSGACGCCTWRHKPHECSLSTVFRAAQQPVELVAERPPPAAGNRRGTRASTAVYGDTLADPSVYLPVRAGPSSRGRRARTTVVPTESASAGSGNNEDVDDSLASNDISESGPALQQDGPSIGGSHVPSNTPAVVVGAAPPQSFGSLLVSLWGDVLRSRFIS